jgi:hypothetical protein
MMFRVVGNDTQSVHHARGQDRDAAMKRVPVCSTKAPSSNPAAGRVTGKVPVTTIRMAAIRKMTTMAGSPDADLDRSTSRNLAHGFCVLERPFFREP